MITLKRSNTELEVKGGDKKTARACEDREEEGSRPELSGVH